MKEIYLIARDSFDLNLLLDPEEFYQKYAFEDEEGFLSIVSVPLYRMGEIKLLIKYLFDSNEPIITKYKSDDVEILDITNLKSKITTYEKLEDFYQDWIKESGRDNNMDEYGVLLDVIGYVQRNKVKKNLLMIVDKNEHYA